MGRDQHSSWKCVLGGTSRVSCHRHEEPRSRGAGAARPLASVRPCGLRPPTELPQLGQEGGEAKC